MHAQCVARDVDGKRQVAGVHWDYDCYGAPGKIAQGRPAMMPNWDKDFEAGRTLLTMNGLPVFEAPLHLEGGSIHSDGQGTLVVTEECLLDPSRNPHLDKEGITNVRHFFGCSLAKGVFYFCFFPSLLSLPSPLRDWVPDHLAHHLRFSLSRW